MPRSSTKSSREHVPAAKSLAFMNEADQLIRMALYGPSGVGKSIFAASACKVPEMSPVLMVDCGTSADSILGDPDFKDVQVARVFEPAGLSKLYTWLHPRGGNNVENFRTIILDEQNEMWWKFMREITSEVAATRDDKDIDDIWQEDFGTVWARMSRVVDEFLSLNTHLIVCALPEIKTDRYDGREYRVFGLPGRLRDEIPAKMGVYAYMDVDRAKKTDDPDDVKRIVYFTPNRRIKGKVRGIARATRLGDYMVNPTMTKLYKLWIGGSADA